MKEQAPPEVVKLSLVNGALLEAPIYETHYRGSNWLAIIDIDATLPGGLSRKWMPKGKGECLYTTEHLSLFDPVEFGADYTTSFNTKKRDRWHGVVITKTDDYLLVEKCASGAKAILRAKVARTSVEDRAKAMEAESHTLKARAAKLDSEVQELRASAEAQHVITESTAPESIRS